MALAQENTNSPAGNQTNSVINAADQQFLLKLARDTITSYLKDKSIPKLDEKDLSGTIKQKLGCFVTLNHRVTGLRGCIGIFEAHSRCWEQRGPRFRTGKTGGGRSGCSV